MNQRWVVRMRLAALMAPLVSHGYWWWKTFRIPGESVGHVSAVYRDLIGRLDQDRIRNLQANFSSAYRTDPSCAAKYTIVRYWLRVNIVRALALHLGRRQRISMLDLGCGPGFFLSVARHFGHDVTGFDLPEEMLSIDMVERDVFDGLTESMDVKSRILRGIVSPDSIPVDGTYDLITGFLVCFNGHGTEREWKYDEWRRFLDTATTHLNVGGLLYLEMNENRQRYGARKYCDEETERILTARGRLVGRAFWMYR